MTASSKSANLRASCSGERFEPSAYLSPHSDLVALTVLLHQSRVHNLISLAHEAADEALQVGELADRRLALRESYSPQSTPIKMG